MPAGPTLSLVSDSCDVAVAFGYRLVDMRRVQAAEVAHSRFLGVGKDEFALVKGNGMNLFDPLVGFISEAPLDDCDSSFSADGSSFAFVHSNDLDEPPVNQLLSHIQRHKDGGRLAAAAATSVPAVGPGISQIMLQSRAFLHDPVVGPLECYSPSRAVPSNTFA